MARIKYDKVQEKIFNNSPIGRAYLEYNNKVGGVPFGYTVGMPVEIMDTVEVKYGGVIGLYYECIKQGKTWEELLNTTGNWDEIPEE